MIDSQNPELIKKHRIQVLARITIKIQLVIKKYKKPAIIKNNCRLNKDIISIMEQSAVRQY